MDRKEKVDTIHLYDKACRLITTRKVARGKSWLPKKSLKDAIEKVNRDTESAIKTAKEMNDLAEVDRLIKNKTKILGYIISCGDYE